MNGPVAIRDFDFFVDERKDGGTLVSLGILCFEKGVAELFGPTLSSARNRESGSGDIGRVHWSDLNDGKVRLGKRWISEFFGAPLTFFLRVDATRTLTTKKNLLIATADALETYFRTPFGFDRRTITVHLDQDTSDPRSLLRDLRKDGGYLRAFAWGNRGSDMNQLADLFLGITHAETNPPATTAVPSEKEVLRRNLIDHTRTEAAARTQNAIFVISSGTVTRLFT
jgi:hypothetical protein